MLWEFLESAVAKYPNQKLCENKTELTYEQLLAQVAAFAPRLEPHKKYGVLCHSELHTAAGILSCFAAGAVAVPLSYRYGERHYEKIIDVMELEFIITDEDGSLYLKPIGYTQTVETILEDVALLLCTSGTTGEPKGAMITEENLTTNLKDIDRYFQVNNKDSIFIIRPLYHCAVLTGEFLIALVKGMEVHFGSGQFNPVKALQYMSERQITVMGGTPTLFYHLCNVLKRQSAPIALKTMMLSGECMTVKVAQTLLHMFPHTKKYNVYGLTEASPRVAWLPPELFEQYPLSVGVPLYSVTAQIVDEKNQMLPPNEVGELVVRGANVMKGYYHNQSATDKALQGGWLHTGDLAYINEDGYLFIKARKDHMIIRGGMNIYPAEIENGVRQDERILEALAYGITGDTVSQRIGLKVVCNALTKTQVYSICQQFLPQHQLPDVIELVEKLPRNASGKVVRPGRYI